MTNMAYTYRFKANIGDIVYAVTDDDNLDTYVDKVTISQIQDNSYHVKINKNGYFSDEIIRSEDFENYSIGYWVEEISFGHAMYFGETLFLTKQEALIEARIIKDERKDDELAKRETE